VSQGGLAIETAEGISDPQRGWICDLFDSMAEKSLPDISRPIGCTENILAPPVPPTSAKRVSGFWFLCSCPQVVPFRTNRTVDGRLAREGIHLLMVGLPELHWTTDESL
jgi:hypothetical protein